MTRLWRPISVISLIIGIFIMMAILATGTALPEIFITSYFTFATFFITTYVGARSYEKTKGTDNAS